jgi:GH24 family phage-related lysozyme (muramidase)
MSDSKILLDPRDGTVKLHGADAVRKAEEVLGRPLTYIEKRVVEEEGYSESPYDDFGGTKTTKTQGFGQTGEFIGMSFEDTLEVHVDRVRRLIPSYDKLPEELQAELVQSAYRGGITGSPKAVDLINSGDWEGASKEFLDHENYRASKRGNGAIAGRMEKVSNAMKSHQPVPTGMRQDGPGETPYDPNDRGEMKSGIRHEFDLIPTQPPLMDPQEAEGLMASTSPQAAPEAAIEPAIEPATEAAPEVAPEAAPEAAPQGTRSVGDMLGFANTPIDLDIRAAKSRKTFTASDAIAEQQAKKDHVNPGLWEIAKASGRVDNTLTDLISVDPTFKIERDFDGQKFWTDNKAAIDAMHGIDREEAAETLGSATSTAEAQFRLKEMQKDYADEQLLLDAGMKALVPRMAISILDPVDIAISTAAAAVTGGVGGAYKVGKMGKILTGAVVAATATGATEAVLARNNAFRDETDVAFAIAAGFTLGGALSSLSRAENGQIQDIANDVANGELDAAAAKMGIDSAGAKRVSYGRAEVRRHR